MTSPPLAVARSRTCWALRDRSSTSTVTWERVILRSGTVTADPESPPEPEPAPEPRSSSTTAPPPPPPAAGAPASPPDVAESPARSAPDEQQPGEAGDGEPGGGRAGPGAGHGSPCCRERSGCRRRSGLRRPRVDRGSRPGALDGSRSGHEAVPTWRTRRAECIARGTLGPPRARGRQPRRSRAGVGPRGSSGGRGRGGAARRPHPGRGRTGDRAAPAGRPGGRPGGGPAGPGRWSWSARRASGRPRCGGTGRSAAASAGRGCWWPVRRRTTGSTRPRACATCCARGRDDHDAPSWLDDALPLLERSRAVLDHLRRLSLDGPVVLAVDDLPWLDPFTRRVVRFALDRLGGRARAAARDGAHLEPRHARSAARRRGPLDRRRRPGAAADAAPAADRPHARCRRSRGWWPRGPASSRTATRSSRSSWRGRTAVPRAPGRGRRCCPLSASACPACPTGTVELARLLALSGPSPLPVLAAAAGTDVDEVVRAGLDAQVLDLDEDFVLRFAHPLIATAVLAGTNAIDRARLRRALADVVPDRDTRTLHLARATAGADERVAADAETAAHRMARRAAPRAAAELFGHSARLTARADEPGDRPAHPRAEPAARLRRGPRDGAGPPRRPARAARAGAAAG